MRMENFRPTKRINDDRRPPRGWAKKPVRPMAKCQVQQRQIQLPIRAWPPLNRRKNNAWIAKSSIAQLLCVQLARTWGNCQQFSVNDSPLFILSKLTHFQRNRLECGPCARQPLDVKQTIFPNVALAWMDLRENNYIRHSVFAFPVWEPMSSTSPRLDEDHSPQAFNWVRSAPSEMMLIWSAN